MFVARRGARVRVAITGAGDHAFRVTQIETALEKNFSPAALDGVFVPSDRLLSDMHGSAEYRADLITVLARRGVEECLAA